MRSISSKLRVSPGFAVALVALVMSVTGSAVALPGKNTVDRNDIVKNAIKSKHIVDLQVKNADLGFGAVASDKVLDESLVGRDVKNGSLTGQDVQDSSLTGQDVADSSLTGQDVADNSLTGQDVQDSSLTGADVRDDSLTGDDVNEATLKGVMPSQIRYVSAQAAPVPGPAGGFPSTVQVRCPAGERAIGGSGAWIIPNFDDNNQPTALDVQITASMPVPANPGTGDATGWLVAGRNFSGTDRALRAYAICVKSA